MNKDQLAKALEIERKKRIAAQNDAVLQNLQTELLKQNMTQEQMRFEAAKAAMQSIVLNSRWDRCHWDVIAEAAVDAADCLLEALAKYPSTEESSLVYPTDATKP